jgi:hypothetical protein
MSVRQIADTNLAHADNGVAKACRKFVPMMPARHARRRHRLFRARIIAASMVCHRSTYRHAGSFMNAFNVLPSLFFIAIFGLAAAVCAQSPPPPDAGPGGPGRDPKVEAAFKACEAQLDGSPTHRVARELIEQCMDAKGFKRPSGPPTDGGPGGPGDDPKIETALKACEAQLGGSPTHRVARELIEQCMDAKGFKRPSGPPPGAGGPPPESGT